MMPHAATVPFPGAAARPGPGSRDSAVFVATNL
jgi:hypothetical protein